jgi:hypothetical protein
LKEEEAFETAIAVLGSLRAIFYQSATEVTALPPLSIANLTLTLCLLSEIRDIIIISWEGKIDRGIFVLLLRIVALPGVAAASSSFRVYRANLHIVIRNALHRAG